MSASKNKALRAIAVFIMVSWAVIISALSIFLVFVEHNVEEEPEVQNHYHCNELPEIRLLSNSIVPEPKQDAEGKPEIVEEKLYYSVTEEERELLARLVYEEGNIESLECQIAIVSVVFNRVSAGAFGGDTIHEVIYEKGQFTVAHMLKNTVPNENNYAAVDYVIKNGPSIPYYVCFFRSSYYFKNYRPYMNLDNTYFSYNKAHVELFKGG